MKTKPEEKTKEVYKNLKDLLLQKRDIPKIDAIVTEYNDFYKLSGKNKVTEGRIRSAIAYSCGEIHKQPKGCYTVGKLRSYNGISGTCVTALCKLQRDSTVFPNSFIYRINEKVLMIEVKPKYADKAKYLLNKIFTKRYIYDIILHGNQLIIMLLSGEDSELCNCKKGGKSCRTDKFSQMDLGDIDECNPFIDSLTADQPLTYEHILQMIQIIVETRDRVL